MDQRFRKVRLPDICCGVHAAEEPEVRMIEKQLLCLFENIPYISCVSERSVSDGVRLTSSKRIQKQFLKASAIEEVSPAPETFCLLL